MESRDQMRSVTHSNDLDTTASNEQEQIEALLEEIKRSQILLIQHDHLLSSVKVAASDPSLSESVQNTINRVLVHDEFVKNKLPESFFSEGTIKKNAAAKLSYDESIPLKDIVEKEVEEKCKNIVGTLKGLEIGPSNTEVNLRDVKMKLYLECETELRKAVNLMCEEQTLFLSLVELRKKSLDDLQNAAHHLMSENRLLDIKSKVELLTLQRDMLVKEDKEMPQALNKLATYWQQESEKSSTSVKQAEKDLEEYARLEKDDTYQMLLKEYLLVVQQTENIETALGKLL